MLAGEYCETTRTVIRSLAFDKRGPSLFSVPLSLLLLALTLSNRISMSSTADITILSTSDDPPVLIKVSRAALVANSKVFADMLSLPLRSDDNNTTIPISETNKEIEPFVAWLQGDEEDAERLSSKLTEVEWESLATLADKYDSWIVRKVVKGKVWSVQHLDCTTTRS